MFTLQVAEQDLRNEKEVFRCFSLILPHSAPTFARENYINESAGAIHHVVTQAGRANKLRVEQLELKLKDR